MIAADDGTSKYGINTEAIKYTGNLIIYTERAKINDDESGWDTVVASSQINCEMSQVHSVQLKITYTRGKIETVDYPRPKD